MTYNCCPCRKERRSQQDVRWLLKIWSNEFRLMDEWRLFLSICVLVLHLSEHVIKTLLPKTLAYIHKNNLNTPQLDQYIHKSYEKIAHHDICKMGCNYVLIIIIYINVKIISPVEKSYLCVKCFYHITCYLHSYVINTISLCIYVFGCDILLVRDQLIFYLRGGIPSNYIMPSYLCFFVHFSCLYGQLIVFSVVHVVYLLGLTSSSTHSRSYQDGACSQQMYLNHFSVVSLKYHNAGTVVWYHTQSHYSGNGPTGFCVWIILYNYQYEIFGLARSGI